MKTSRLLHGTAAMLLAITALWEAKGNRKFNGFSTAVNWNGTIRVSGVNVFTTVAAHGSRIFLLTDDGTQEWYLFTKVNRVKIAYLKE